MPDTASIPTQPTPVPAMAATATAAGIPTALHRVRFVDYHPSPITSLAFTPIPFPSPDPAVHGSGSGTGTTAVIKGQMGALVCARQNGEVQIWEWAEGEKDDLRVDEEKTGSWVLRRVLPAILAYPTISLMTLAIRDPESFYASGPSSPASSSTDPSSSTSSFISSTSSPTTNKTAFDDENHGERNGERAARLPKLDELRLFTAGSDSGDLVERCLSTGRVLQTTPLPSGPIWSLALSPTHTHLAISTSAPHIHLLSLDPSTSELNVASLNTATGGSGVGGRMEALPGKVRTLGIAWGPPTRQRVKLDGREHGQEGEDAWVWKPSYLVSAHSDSSVRKFNLATGRVVGRMSVGKLSSRAAGGGKGRKRHSVVWAVGCLIDGTIISADSLGQVTFWDGKSLAQIKSFKAHAADALCLVISPDGKAVYSSGPDQRVAQFTFVPSANTSSGAGGDDAQDAPSSTSTSSGEWQQTSIKRLHKHDVRTLAMFPGYSLAPRNGAISVNPGVAPILASGGLDMSIVLTSAGQAHGIARRKGPLAIKVEKNALTNKGKETFADAVKMDLGYVPRGHGTDVMAVARGKRLVLVRRARGVALFRVRDMRSRGEEAEGETVPGGWDKVLEMNFQLRTSLVASTISSDGRWLAVSDLYETKVYKLRYRDEPGEDTVTCTPKRIKAFTPLLHECLPHLANGFSARGTGASSLIFTPDSNVLVIGFAMHSHMVVIEVGDDDAEEGVSVLKSFAVPVKEGSRAVRGLPMRTANGINGHDVDHDDMSVDGVNGGGVGDESGSSAAGADNRSDAGESDSDLDDSSDDEEEVGSEGHRPRFVMMSVSRDGQWLAGQDSSSRIGVWSLDVLKLHCLVPTFAEPPTAMTFSNASTLVFGFAGSNTIQAFDVDDRRLLLGKTKVTYTDERVLGIESVATSTVGGRGKVLAWGSNWVSTLEVPSGETTEKNKKTRKRRKSRPNDPIEVRKAMLAEDEPFKIIGRYREVGAVAMMGPGELMVVERPFTDLTGLPTAFVKPRYNS